jgi:hypothetical protein
MLRYVKMANATNVPKGQTCAPLQEPGIRGAVRWRSCNEPAWL